MIEIQKRELPDLNGSGVAVEWRVIVDKSDLVVVPFNKYELAEMNRLSDSPLISDKLMALSLLASAIEREEQKKHPTHLTQQEGKE